MTVDEKCEATAPRVIPCADELLLAELRALKTDGSGALADATMKTLQDSPRVTKQQARQMHEIHCVGSTGTEYQDSIVACWNEKSCDAFAACVAKR
jgi:hypothetical protein